MAGANPLLAPLAPAAVAKLADACDSSSFLPLLAEGKLPRNYAAVLLRCEVARQRVGLPALVP